MRSKNYKSMRMEMLMMTNLKIESIPISKSNITLLSRICYWGKIQPRMFCRNILDF